MTGVLPPGATEASVLRYNLAQELAQLCPSALGEEIALTGRYDEVSEPDRLVMTVPGDAVTAITLTPAPNGTTQIAYAFDVDESMRTMVTESVDDVLGRVSTVLAGIA